MEELRGERLEIVHGRGIDVVVRILLHELLVESSAVAMLGGDVRRCSRFTLQLAQQHVAMAHGRHG